MIMLEFGIVLKKSKVCFLKGELNLHLNEKSKIYYKLFVFINSFSSGEMQVMPTVTVNNIYISKMGHCMIKKSQ